MPNSELSIVVPTFGRFDNLLKCISGISQLKNVEIVIVDDNGKRTDLQKNLELEIINMNLPNIIYYPLANNSGAAIARNVGVSLASNEYIAFLDDDDEILINETFEKFDFMVESGSDICCSNMLILKNNKEVIIHKNSFRGKTKKEFLLNGNCWTPMVMIKKSIFEKIGGFDDVPYYQDHCFLLKAHINNLSISHFPKKTFIHNDHNQLRISNQRKNSSGLYHRAYLERELSNKVSLTDKELCSFNYVNQRLKFFGFCIDNRSRYRRLNFYYENCFKYSKTAKSWLKCIKDIFTRIIFI